MSARGSSRRWAPERLDLPQSSSLDMVEEEFPDRSISPSLLGHATPVQHVLGTLVVREAMRRRARSARLVRDRTGLLLVEAASGDGASRGFVVTTESSLEPRHSWPVLLPQVALEAVSVQWVAACSVPKRPALEDLPHRGLTAYVIGWLSMERVLSLPLIAVDPHMGHPFRAHYRQALNREHLSLEEFPA